MYNDRKNSTRNVKRLEKPRLSIRRLGSHFGLAVSLIVVIAIVLCAKETPARLNAVLVNASVLALTLVAVAIAFTASTVMSTRRAIERQIELVVLHKTTSVAHQGLPLIIVNSRESCLDVAIKVGKTKRKANIQ